MRNCTVIAEPRRAPALRASLLLAILAPACAAGEDTRLEPAPRAPSPAAPDEVVALDAGLDTTGRDIGFESDLDPPPPDAGLWEDAGVDPGDGAECPVRDPGREGPFGVGVRTIELTDPGRQRSFSVDVWYPVDPQQVGGSAANRYALELPLIGPIFEVETPARRDATPATSSGPFPLVLFSHGYGGIRFQSYFLTEHLASHGFVVASPDHPGNRLIDFQNLGNEEATLQSVIDRPLDVLLVKEALLSGAVSSIVIDRSRIATTGHSIGAWTALEVARRDPEIRVMFPMAPGFRNGGRPDFVAALGRPLMIFGGSEDTQTSFESHQRRPYDLALPPKFLVKVLGAGHLDFSNLCEVRLASRLVNDGCDPSKIEPAEVHARVRALSVAFLEEMLNACGSYRPYLEPASVMGMGRLEYWWERSTP